MAQSADFQTGVRLNVAVLLRQDEPLTGLMADESPWHKRSALRNAVGTWLCTMSHAIARLVSTERDGDFGSRLTPLFERGKDIRRP